MITPRPDFLLRALLTSAVVAMLSATAQAHTLLSRYTLDGDTKDAGGLGVDGMLTGQATFGAPGSGVGCFTKALALGGAANDYVSAATGGNEAFGADALTITMWVNVESVATGDRLVSNITASSGVDLFVNASGVESSGRFRVVFAINGTTGGSGVISSKAGFATNTWVFLAVTYDSAHVRFYGGDETRGATLDHTVPKTGRIVASTAALEIGGTPATPADRSPKALINDVRIYDGALSLQEIETVRAEVMIPEPSNYLAIAEKARAEAIVLR